MAVVTAALIVAKVEIDGKLRDRYLGRGEPLPDNVPADEVERLIEAGVVEEVKAKPAPMAEPKD